MESPNDQIGLFSPNKMFMELVGDIGSPEGALEPDFRAEGPAQKKRRGGERSCSSCGV